MHWPRTAAHAVVGLCLCLGPHRGFGSAAAPPLVIDDPAIPSRARILSPELACVLEPGPVSTGTSYYWNTPDAFTHLYWRIPQQECAACAGQGLNPATIQFRVRWFGPCAAQAEVSIVGVTGPPNCRVPDPANVLCGPVTHPIVGTGVGSAYHTLPVPAECCLPGDAFLRLRFIGLENCYPSGTPSPGIGASSTPCVNCEEYIATAVGLPSLTSWCPIAPGLTSLWVQLESECCAVVGVDPHPATTGPTGISTVETFSRRVRLAVTLAGSGPRPVEVDAYDIAGRRVRTLLRADLGDGRHRVDWDGTSDAGERLPSGVYKVRLRAGTERAVATAVLLD